MAKFATGKHARAISDRSGLEFPYREMVREWNGSLVHISEFEPKQPQLEPKPMNGDAISLANIRPDRIENAVPYLLPTNSFKTYEAGSRIINVTAPGHGITNGDTKRFRGAPLAITAAGGSFQFTNPASFDGITGTNIAKATGYTITTGVYVSDARDTSDYSVANFFHFTVDTDTATKGGVSGGGLGCSVGPVTLSA
ncbi:hypothetical protein [uncultured virus]|jgi:hypothetical protein|uniref:Uncharacterized protein n=1 Tax=uncultured virus TaxID=340016 RepID=A0A218ML27_9VIRU|nr:hypothetical protein [uncultured virus]